MSLKLFNTNFVETNEYHWINRCISIVLESITVSLLLYHGYRMYLWKFKGIPSTKKTTSNVAHNVAKWRKLSHIFTIITLFSFCIMGGNYALSLVLFLF